MHGKAADYGEKTPILIGVAELTNKSPQEPLDPLSMMISTSNAAFNDAAGGNLQDVEKVKTLIESVVMISFNSWGYEGGNNRLPQDLSDRLGISPRLLEYTSVGGNLPQLKLNEACLALEQGKITGALLTGCETLESMLRFIKGEISSKDWPKGGPAPPFLENDKEELKYAVTAPIRVYPMIETAIRHQSGRAPAAHAAYMGRLFARYAQVASKNPNAWFKNNTHTAETISTPSPTNRYICYPYTKLMNAFPMVNQGATVILTTVGNAIKCGIPSEKWVFPMGGAHFVDVEQFTRRRNLAESPAIRNAAALALLQAGKRLQDIQFLDIYSCFPSAVQVAMKEMGITDDDPRELTVTGGLPYFGGPGNNYSMHAIVQVAQKIRLNPQSYGLVYANGMYLTKHAVGIYGKTNPNYSWSEQFTKLPSIQESIEKAILPPLEKKAEGPFRVEAFMISYDKKSGGPKFGVLLGTLVNSGKRALANFDAKEGELLRLQENELVGRIGLCYYDDKSKKNKVKFTNAVL